ncbi:MAG: archaeosortase/exosortase family protein [Candidatus Hodarchaeales archaeon]
MPNKGQINKLFINFWFFKKIFRVLVPVSVCLTSILTLIVLNMCIKKYNLADALVSYTINGIVLIHNSSIFIMTMFVAIIIFILLIKAKPSTEKSSSIGLMLIIVIAWALLEELNQIDLTLISGSELLISNTYRTICFRIIDSCSGIDSMVLFLTFFIIFSILTRKKQKFPLNYILISGILGVLGAFLVNLIRIIILIVISLKANSLILESVHPFLGGILLLIYLCFFWITLWSNLDTTSHERLIKIKTN